MNHIFFLSTFVQGLSSLLRTVGLRRLAGWIVLGLMTIFYLVLSIASSTSRDAVVIAASPLALAAQQATPTFLINPSETVTDSLDALSPEFLEEYDRLSGARNSTEPSARNTTLNVDAGSPIGTILVSLLIMVGLVYAGVWGLRHYSRRQSGEMLSPEGKLFFLQETQTLGPNQKLHLLRLGGELLLLGATEHNITCLARYDADQFTKTFDEHLQAAHRTHTTQSAATTPVPLQASLNELRKVQRWQRGDDNA